MCGHGGRVNTRHIMCMLAPGPSAPVSATVGEDRLAVEQQYFRQPVVQRHKQLLVREQCQLPEVEVSRYQFVECLSCEVFHLVPAQVLVSRHTANRALARDPL
jgi:hypothetical protein